jgi:hypothetical protein
MNVFRFCIGSCLLVLCVGCSQDKPVAAAKVAPERVQVEKKSQERHSRDDFMQSTQAARAASSAGHRGRRTDMTSQRQRRSRDRDRGSEIPAGGEVVYSGPFDKMPKEYLDDPELVFLDVVEKDGVMTIKVVRAGP